MAKHPKHECTNIHHRVCTSRQGSDHPINLMRWRQETHDHFHHFFGNKLPHEMFLEILRINWPVLSQSFRTRMMELLMTDETMYDPRAFKVIVDQQDRFRNDVLKLFDEAN